MFYYESEFSVEVKRHFFPGYRLQAKLREGNVFTGVCLFTGGQGRQHKMHHGIGYTCLHGQVRSGGVSLQDRTGQVRLGTPLDIRPETPSTSDIWW